ncbi:MULTISPECIES: GNAT family N-acetyltransferase [unclassified Rhizobium]|uniref:GNAT family N-acetyltransferase n=1 Tax=unclassified Rhizobium TaxID=2613769 RepID=UPI0007157040|nr:MULTISPECIES: N-acetyltransferase [unclassified Rhizobium]KQS89638.1 acetyltransferase [Rhizobium sp. Leaf391]KQS94918.1 acetyltransferase [Rhizobium sp. Leaf386]KQU01294.1 acetyltransferase [Rhizobium sp. Leaf453]
MAAVLDSVRAFFAQNAFTIDMENAGDVVARENLLDRAMGPNRRRKSSETLRRGRVPAEGLALVARDPDGHVIGTVRLWNVEAGVTRDGAAVDALLLGPLAVDGAHEGKGIGAALMRAAIGEAKTRGHGAILLVGDAPYYERFGFFAEKARHLVMPGPFERNRFLALELKDGWLNGAAGMLVANGRKLAMPKLRRAA